MSRVSETLWRLVPRIPAFKDTIDELRWLRQENSLLREELRRKRLPRVLAPATPGALTVGSLSEAVNPARYDQHDWQTIHQDLENYAVDKHCFQSWNGAIYRKGWEWTHCVYGLQQLGMLKREHRAIGVGAGRECVIFYLADHIGHVTATDLYGANDWSSDGGKEANLEVLELAKSCVPASVDLSRIRFEHRDGRNLGYPDDRFDFAWSLSSIEHFGGHGGALQALKEMGRVVRPGGIVAVATELLLLEEHSHPEFFTRSKLIDGLIRPVSPTLELVGDVNFDTLTYEYLVDSVTMPEGRDRKRRHVVLNDGDVQWTSVMLFFRKEYPR
jgi:SAM-dependent methyltransferase